jgi:hypothetical protein
MLRPRPPLGLKRALAWAVVSVPCQAVEPPNPRMVCCDEPKFTSTVCALAITVVSRIVDTEIQIARNFMNILLLLVLKVGE